MDKLTHQEFSIGLPEGWYDETEVLLKGAAVEGISPTITVNKEKLNTAQSSEEFAYAQLEGLKEAISQGGFESFEESTFELAGFDAFRRIYSFSFSDESLTQMQIYLVRGKTAYIITATTSKKQFAKDLPIFEEAIRRFRFQD